MAVVTHQPFLPSKHALQPSAMPAPPPSVSPRQPGAFRLPQKYEQQPSQLCDAALSSLTPNAQQRPVQGEAGSSRLSLHPKIVTYHTAIPHLPSAPDVFTPVDYQPNLFKREASTSVAKRPGQDLSSSMPPKKLREPFADADSIVNGTSQTIAGKKYESEQDRWRQKWIKSFPTLIFHFEMGAEEGAGKGLKGRALKMGAVSDACYGPRLKHADEQRVDQFFSTKITHLIVKTLASPTKAKPVVAKRECKPCESPLNPFLDNTGVTDLALKAEALGIKVWSVKSRLLLCAVLIARTARHFRSSGPPHSWPSQLAVYSA
jgi:hypothetical protein